MCMRPSWENTYCCLWKTGRQENFSLVRRCTSTCTEQFATWLDSCRFRIVRKSAAEVDAIGFWRSPVPRHVGICVDGGRKRGTSRVTSYWAISSRQSPNLWKAAPYEFCMCRHGSACQKHRFSRASNALVGFSVFFCRFLARHESVRPAPLFNFRAPK